jgi:hypothetical protein
LSPFLKYRTGDEITDDKAIEAIRKSEHAHYVTPVVST